MAQSRGTIILNMFEGRLSALPAPPITTEAEYEAAIVEVEPLLASEPAEGTPTYLRAMALVAGIEAYETAQGWNMDECSDANYEGFKR